MKLSINSNYIRIFITQQLNNFFPDNKAVSLKELEKPITSALDRLDYCFSKVSNHRYNRNDMSFYNHLYSDHNIVFYWLLSNEVYMSSENIELASKLYYLNKTLHGFDCMYDTKLPAIFLIFHGVGTMLGKADYDDYFVALQGCTVGSHKGDYPKFGKGVSLTANSSVIGNCVLGDRTTISTGTRLYQTDLPTAHTAFFDMKKSALNIKPTKECYAQQFFKQDLNEI